MVPAYEQHCLMEQDRLFSLSHDLDMPPVLVLISVLMD